MAPKRSDRPITKADLEAFITTQDDFALELFAYSLALEFGFAATHAGSYTDRITGKTRQFDVRANKKCGSEFHVYLAVECKCLSPSFPLLISQIPRHPLESFQDVIRGAGDAQVRHGRTHYPEFRVSRFDRGNSLYPVNRYVGKALVQVGLNERGDFVSNDSEVFEKWGQAIASANGQLRTAADLSARAGMSQASIVLPVLLVPDEMLWVANYSENGKLQEGPVQQDEVRFYIGDKHKFDPEIMREFTISHLHIVTKTGFRNLLEQFADDDHELSYLLQTLP